MMDTMSLMRLTEHYCSESDLRPVTKNQYIRVVIIFEKDFGKVWDISTIQRSHLLQWRSKLLERVKRITCNNYIRHLKVLFNFAKFHKLIGENPFEKLFVTQPIKPKKLIDDSAIQQINDILDRNLHATEFSYKMQPAWFWKIVFNTFYSTGMRLNQLIHLQWQDIDLKNKSITLNCNSSKTHREWSIPITNELTTQLTTLREMSQAALERSPSKYDQVFNVTLFTHRYKVANLTRWHVLAFFQELTKAINSPVSSHRLRHTIATDLMKSPERNLVLVKTLLGHSNIKTTLEYVTPDTGQLRSLLEARSSANPS